MRVARFLVQGVDVWVNTPRRPLEASGTSGMKAAANGAAEPERARRLVGGRVRPGHGLRDRAAPRTTAIHKTQDADGCRIALQRPHGRGREALSTSATPRAFPRLDPPHEALDRPPGSAVLDRAHGRATTPSGPTSPRCARTTRRLGRSAALGSGPRGSGRLSRLRTPRFWTPAGAVRVGRRGLRRRLLRDVAARILPRTRCTRRSSRSSGRCGRSRRTSRELDLRGHRESVRPG